MSQVKENGIIIIINSPCSFPIYRRFPNLNNAKFTSIHFAWLFTFFPVCSLLRPKHFLPEQSFFTLSWLFPLITSFIFSFLPHSTGTLTHSLFSPFLVLSTFQCSILPYLNGTRFLCCLMGFF